VDNAEASAAPIEKTSRFALDLPPRAFQHALCNPPTDTLCKGDTMNLWKTTTSLLAALLVCAAGSLATSADEDPKAPPVPKPADPGTLVVIDSAGKEQKLKSWKIKAGTARLKWLAPAEKAPPAKEGKEDKDEKPAPKAPKIAPAGTEFFPLRPQTNIHFAAGVVTYIPLDRLRSLDFDSESRTVTARVATSPKAEEDILLTGSTRAEEINRLTIEAEIDLGEAGVAAITYQGGVARGSIRGVRFPAPKVEAVKNAGRPAVVLSNDKGEKGTHKVTDLTPLYRLKGGAEKLLPTLMFKRTLKIDVSKI
jgi:hypothetical protein